jgi:hypothetical protein
MNSDNGDYQPYLAFGDSAGSLRVAKITAGVQNDSTRTISVGAVLLKNRLAK